MHEVHRIGIEFILWMQQFQTPATYFFWEVFTNFGGTYYLFMIPLLLWCVNYRAGLRVLLVFLGTLVLNAVLKEAFADPRPFELDARILSEGEEGYGLPSGHAQLAVVFWGVLAKWVGRAWFWWLAIAIMFLMGLSRMILGVHFPSDVLAGWALGGLTLWLYLPREEALENWMSRYSPVGQAGGALLAAAAAFVSIWIVSGGESSLGVGAAGFVFGAGAGAAAGVSVVPFTGQGMAWQRAVRFVVGMPLMLFLVGGMQGLGVPGGQLGTLVIAVDLAVLGLWLTLAAPWLFTKLRLSSVNSAV